MNDLDDILDDRTIDYLLIGALINGRFVGLTDAGSTLAWDVAVMGWEQDGDALLKFCDDDQQRVDHAVGYIQENVLHVIEEYPERVLP